ncbi:MAG TPA: RNA polymerase factor sigma-54 [Sedimentisphaerales bacterium]|nr:RNA polymerase factor sigma-54 [Sedimentisphaerales bacterium]
MKLSMSPLMRLEQRMKLAPRMIQAMEILQLPMLAMQERLEHELSNNPVLETAEEGEEPRQPDESPELPGEKDLVVKEDPGSTEDFERLESVDDDFREYLSRAAPMRRRSYDDSDTRMDAMQNAAAPQCSLRDYLLEQWGLVVATDAVLAAGRAIIDYIDARGYLSVQLEQLYNKDKSDFAPDDLTEALRLIQQLEPTGVGARDVKECLLIQLAAAAGDTRDYRFEQELVAKHLDELLENRLPEITRAMNCTIENINAAIARLAKFDTSPGLAVGQDRNQVVRADIIVEADEGPLGYSVRLADTGMPELRINASYAKMAMNKTTDEETRKFLRNHIRSAQWIIEAIEQRRDTLLKVAVAVVRHQKDFLDNGPLHLKALPMSKVAQEVGVHVATVSRAVAGKYVQCVRGILPLRSFFTGGAEDQSGQNVSWDAVRTKLQQIVGQEDKARPLSDDEIVERLVAAGFAKIARRTVAKYRSLLNIPAAKYRKKF